MTENLHQTLSHTPHCKGGILPKATLKSSFKLNFSFKPLRLHRINSLRDQEWNLSTAGAAAPSPHSRHTWSKEKALTPFPFSKTSQKMFWAKAGPWQHHKFPKLFLPSYSISNSTLTRCFFPSPAIFTPEERKKQLRYQQCLNSTNFCPSQTFCHIPSQGLLPKILIIPQDLVLTPKITWQHHQRRSQR